MKYTTIIYHHIIYIDYYIYYSLFGIFIFHWFCFINHILDFTFTQSSTTLNTNTLFLSSSFVFTRNMNYSISINIKSDLNLWHSSWSRWNPLQIELSQHFIICYHLSFSLEHSDRHSSLVISSSTIYLTLLGRNGSVSIDHSSEHSSQCLNT